VLLRAVIDEREFAFKAWLGQNGAAAQAVEAPEVKLTAERSFVPPLMDTGSATRTLSYRIKRLSLVDSQGRESVLFALRMRWLFTVTLPLISLVKSLHVNQHLHVRELWRTTWHLWSELIMFPASR
jgi:hypothetical protein